MGLYWLFTFILSTSTFSILSVAGFIGFLVLLFLVGLSWTFPLPFQIFQLLMEISSLTQGYTYTGPQGGRAVSLSSYNRGIDPGYAQCTSSTCSPNVGSIHTNSSGFQVVSFLWSYHLLQKVLLKKHWRMSPLCTSKMHLQKKLMTTLHQDFLMASFPYCCIFVLFLFCHLFSFCHLCYLSTYVVFYLVIQKISDLLCN